MVDESRYATIFLLLMDIRMFLFKGHASQCYTCMPRVGHD
jgi:hypothetical protein